MPEAYLAIGCLTLLVALGATWAPLLAFAPLLLLAAALIAIRAATLAGRAPLPTPGLSAPERAARRGVAALLHLLQPLFRLDGRLRHGLTPWRRRPHPSRSVPVAREVAQWREEWSDPFDDLRAVRERLLALGAVVRLGGDFDAWDLEVSGGPLGGARVTTLVEEHNGGRRMIRTRCRPRCSGAAFAVVALTATLGIAAAASGALPAAAVLLVAAGSLAIRMLAEAGSAIATVLDALAATHGRLES
jgi:hypothetical protein